MQLILIFLRFFVLLQCEVITGYQITKGKNKNSKRGDDITQRRKALWSHYQRRFSNGFNTNHSSYCDADSIQDEEYDPRFDPDNNDYEENMKFLQNITSSNNNNYNSRNSSKEALARASAWYHVTYHPDYRRKRNYKYRNKNSNNNNLDSTYDNEQGNEDDNENDNQSEKRKGNRNLFLSFPWIVAPQLLIIKAQKKNG